MSASEGSGSTVTAPEKYLNEIYITVLKHSVSLEYIDKESVFGEQAYRATPTRHDHIGMVTMIAPGVFKSLDCETSFIKQHLRRCEFI
jgi:hypothetical protein